MRLDHTLVFDETLGASTKYTRPTFNDALALTNELELVAVADEVSGTSPTLTVQAEHSPDGIHWINKNSPPEINGAVLNTTLNTTAIARDPGILIGSGFSRLRVSLGGTTPTAHVRIWATTGRKSATPLTILGSSILQWCRSDLGVTLNGSTVSAWDDLSGNGNRYAQATAAQQPTYTAVDASLNNLPTISFNATNSQVLVNTTLNLPAPGTTPNYVFVVFKNVWTSSAYIFGDNTTATNMSLQQFTATPQIRMLNITGVNSNSGISAGTWGHVEVGFTNSTNDFLQAFATTVTGANAGNTDPAAGRQIGASAGTGFSNISIAEIFYVNRIPTAAERGALNSYLVLRYGGGI